MSTSGIPSEPTPSRRTPSEVVDAYYRLLEAGETRVDALGEILDPALVFEGPAGVRPGAEAFVAGVAGFIETVQHIHEIARVEAGPRIAVIYDAVLPGGQVRMAELLTVKDGRVSEIRLVFPPADYVAKGGR